MTDLVYQYTPKPDEWSMMKDQAKVIAQSGLAPNALRNKPEAIVTIALKGRELGIPPMQALSHIHVIQGKPTLSAELMRALVQRAGHKLWIDPNSDEKKAVVHGQRWDRHLGAYDEVRTAEFTIEEAKQAGLTGKDNWRKYPKAMLVARATAIICRETFADVTMGATYTPDEIDPDVELDQEGHPVGVDYRDAEFQRQLSELPGGTEVPAEGVPADSGDPVADSGGVSAPVRVLNPEAEPTDKQIGLLHKILADKAIEDDIYRAALRAIYEVSSSKDLTRGEVSTLIDLLQDEKAVERFVGHGIDQMEKEANE